MYWRFDLNNPYESTFEETLLTMANLPYVLEMVKRKCVDIQRDPKNNYRAVVDGRLVYIARTGKVQHPEIGPLLIVYTLSESQMLIQRVLVCKASDVEDDQASTTSEIARSLRVAIDAALKHAAG